MYATHDSTKDKDFELELSWVCKGWSIKRHYADTHLSLYGIPV